MIDTLMAMRYGEALAELNALKDFVRSLRSFRTKNDCEGKDRGEYGFAWYGQDGAIVLHGSDAYDAWTEFVKIST